MDEQTLQSLSNAYRATPGNQDLLEVLLKGHLELGALDAIADLLELTPADQVTRPDIRRLAAEALIAGGFGERALDFLLDDEPQDSLLKARALLILDRLEEGRKEYETAILKEPALESPDLAAQLKANVAVFQSARGEERRLKVISNDNTEAEELRQVLAPPQEPVDFSDVGGLDKVKEQVRKRIILPFQKPALFARFRKKVGGGILMYGPPGCGKTLLARATAGECSAQFLNVQISDVLDMYIGESERKLHALFEQARSSAPTVIFFDEIEALGGKREYRRESTAAKLVSQFLSELDGFQQENSGVLVLGATNVPWAIDPAFRRPGRFDRVLFVPPPDRGARQTILELLLQERPTDLGLKLEVYAKASGGFSGADLENLIETASEHAIDDSIDRGEEVPINKHHLEAALKEVKPTTLEWLTTARNYARYANEGGQYNDVLDFIARHGKSR